MADEGEKLCDHVVVNFVKIKKDIAHNFLQQHVAVREQNLHKVMLILCENILAYSRYALLVLGSRILIVHLIFQIHLIYSYEEREESDTDSSLEKLVIL